MRSLQPPVAMPHPALLATPQPAPQATPQPALRTAPLRVLIVDDEALARERLRRLLACCREPEVEVVAEAADARAVQAPLDRQTPDLALIDIDLPGTGGLALARALAQRPQAPAVIFVTAHPDHALPAFDLGAVDYLTKPVRLERLLRALQRAQAWAARGRGPAFCADAQQPSAPASAPALLAAHGPALIVHGQGQDERIPLDDVLYVKAELKYLTVGTAVRTHLMSGSLQTLERHHADRFVRVHRNALVTRQALRALVHERRLGSAGCVSPAGPCSGWRVRLAGIDVTLPVSRRQLATVRAALR